MRGRGGSSKNAGRAPVVLRAEKDALSRWELVRATRRGVRSGGAAHRGAESPRSCLRRVIRLVARTARLCRAISASEISNRSRQPNTHSTELRELRYPWHPWFGRAVTVYEVLVKHGHSVSRCGLEEERHRLSIEVPTWMFEPAACGRLRVMAVPVVNCDALRALQTLLRSAARSDPGDVLEAQHRSLPVAGGADAPVREPTETLATHAVSSASLASVVSDVTFRDPREDDPVAGAAPSRARRRRRRRRVDAGGAR